MSLIETWQSQLPLRFRDAALSSEDEGVLDEVARLLFPVGNGEHIEGFVGLLASRSSTARPSREHLFGLNLRSLYLAYEVTLGEKTAVEEFRQSLFLEVTGPLSLTAELSEGLWNELVEKGRLLEYSGRGELKAWLRLFCLRHAPAKKEQAALNALELEAVRACISTALKRIKASDRGYLTMSDEEAVRKMKVLDGVSQASAEEALRRVRDELLFFVRRDLMEIYKIERSRVDSLLRTVFRDLRHYWPPGG